MLSWKLCGIRAMMQGADDPGRQGGHAEAHRGLAGAAQKAHLVVEVVEHAHRQQRAKEVGGALRGRAGGLVGRWVEWEKRWAGASQGHATRQSTTNGARISLEIRGQAAQGRTARQVQRRTA